MTQYAKRKIDVTINAGEGQFGDDKGTDVTLTGLRVSASLVYAGGTSQAEAHIRIFGLTLAMVNQLTGMGPFATLLRTNTILVAAGDEDGRMSTIYQGQIYSAYGDFSGAPEVVFNIMALAVAVDAVKPVNAKGFRGAIEASAVMQYLADLMGLTLEDFSAPVTLSNPYYCGTALQQVKDCAKEAGLEYSIEFGKLVVWDKSGRKEISGPVKISPETGMVGYPNFSSQGISVTTLFNPDLVLASNVEISSELTVACGLWNIVSAAHILESETPNGQWFTKVNCIRVINE